MKSSGGPGKKKWLLFLLAPLFCLVLAVGVVLIGVTLDPGVEPLQSPNQVAAYHANRKLGVLENSLKNSRKGFIRLTELEINSLIQKELKRSATNQVSTNAVLKEVPARGTVVLTSTNFTLVTWHKEPLRLFSVTLPLQRTFVFAEPTNKVAFRVTGMKLGKISVPRSMWADAESRFDPGRRLVYRVMPWLEDAVTAETSQNDLSKVPELKLYSYMPSNLKR